MYGLLSISSNRVNHDPVDYWWGEPIFGEWGTSQLRTWHANELVLFKDWCQKFPIWHDKLEKAA